MARAGASPQKRSGTTFLGCGSVENTKPSFCSLEHSITNGFRNVFMWGFSPNQSPSNNIFLALKYGGSSLIDACKAQMD